MPARTIGVVGGVSSFATAEYYRRLNREVNSRVGGHAAADVIVSSVDFGVIERLVSEGRWDEVGRHLAGRALGLQRAGAAFVLIAANSMHRVAPEIEQAITIPLVHIVDVTAEAACAVGARRLGVLGTNAVMEPGFYHDRFATHGIELLAPAEPDRLLVHNMIFGELTRGVTTAAARNALTRLVDDLTAEGVDGVVLACTELGLAFDPQASEKVPVYDTTQLHVDAAVRLSLGRTD